MGQISGFRMLFHNSNGSSQGQHSLQDLQPAVLKTATQLLATAASASEAHSCRKTPHQTGSLSRHEPGASTANSRTQVLVGFKHHIIGSTRCQHRPCNSTKARLEGANQLAFCGAQHGIMQTCNNNSRWRHYCVCSTAGRLAPCTTNATCV